MEVVPYPDQEPGWQRTALLGEPWEERELFPGTQRHICCLFLLQGWLLLPRYAPDDLGQEAPSTVFQQMASPPCGGTCCQLFYRLPQVAVAGH